MRGYRDLVDQDPYGFLEQARDEDPYWDEGLRAWVVTGYKNCLLVNQREDLFRMPWTELGGKEVWGRSALFVLDGDAHRRLYTAIVKFLTPRVIDDYRVRSFAPSCAA